MAGRPSFEQAALPHMGAAYNLAFWLLRNRTDAEDAVQDAYLRAFRAYASLQGDDIRPWLMTIVRNVAYRALAKRGRFLTRRSSCRPPGHHTPSRSSCNA